LPSWQTFENVRIDVVHELQVSLHSPFYINYADEEVLKFISKCREKLNYEPYKTSRKGTGINYTFLGYDIGMYFFQNMRKYRSKLCSCIEYGDSDQLLTEYRFRRNPLTGSLENSGFNYIRYDKDYVVRTLELPKKKEYPEKNQPYSYPD
jgi:hypothetical protein